MSHDDLLDSATEALRQVTRSSGSYPAVNDTLDHLLGAIGRERRARQRRGFMVLALSFALLGSTTWAATTGRFPMPWHAAEGLLGSATTRHAASLSDDAEERSEHAALATSSVLVIPPAPIESLPTTRGRQPRRLEDTSTNIEALYEVAHHAHFVAHDPAVALAAWDRYLLAMPEGQFVLEAQYNRALCLIRLGRIEEAIVALDEFTVGAHEGYRQKDAQALVAALRERMLIRP